MAAIQAFWFVALAAAERIAIWPESVPMLWTSRSTSEVPIFSVSAWLMNRWSGHVTSESNETTLMPAAWACFSDGHRADGSLPAITMASAWAWIADWIDGIC